MALLFPVLISALLWRLRGILGWPFTMLFAAVQAWTLWPAFGLWSLVFAMWVILGELSGWKPKLIADRGEWWQAAFSGFLIGGIGAAALPLSTWLHRRFGGPPFPNNLKATKLPFWDTPKFLLDWRGAWNEVYFGAIFSLLLQLIVVTTN